MFSDHDVAVDCGEVVLLWVVRLALPSLSHLINQLSIITNHVLLCALDTSLQLEMPSIQLKNSQINTTEGSVCGMGLLAVCFVGACPVVKGA